jgi:stage V sporulation protein B
MGVLCGIFFFLFGNLLGTLLFHSQKAGSFIVSLSYICPFLYLGSVLSSILHGLGKAGCAFALQLASLSIRLLFVFIFIPLIGIRGYLIGILVSQLVFCVLIFIALKDYIYYNKSVL